MPTRKTTNVTMDDLLTEFPLQTLDSGQVVEATVISADRGDIWLDLGPLGSGLVAKREFNTDTDLTPGAKVSASVLEPESMYGFPVLSLKKVAREKGWEYLQQVMESGETIQVQPYDANRGGLLIEVEGIRGFLPVSQLTAQHYPRVSNADKDEILQRLHSLVKQTLSVRVLDVDRDQNKLIVSEKEAQKELTQKRLSKLKVGDVVEGIVTGTVDFGVFVTAEDIEGLIHISEISWDRVTNPSDYVKVGQNVKAKIIAMDGDKLSLSMKQLQADPWVKDIEDFKKGDVVEGTITRVTPFGAFIQLTPAIEALVHVSELSEADKKIDPKDLFSVGEKRSFKILEIDKEARKISLTLKDSKAKAKSTKSIKA
jgi:small subunit ribosomal protein S1